MLNAKTIFAAGMFPVLFSGCSTDVATLASYKQIPVVYGLLNVSDTVQWIRINKAYLGEGNALVMAQQPDSINYADVLDVTIEEYNGHNLLRTLNLQRDSGVLKDAGQFANVPNILYRTNFGEKIFSKNSYRLKIMNRQTDSIATSETTVVDSISIFSPSNAAAINFAGPFPYTVRWNSVPEGFLYELIIRFHYTDINTSTGDSTEKFIDWKHPTISNSTGGSSEFTIDIDGQNFYIYAASQLEPIAGIKRSAGKLDFNFTVAGKEYRNYVEVNQPPTGINQSIPLYTNIQGGIGIFSSRLTQSVKNRSLTGASLDSLKFGSHTGHLGFQ